MTTFDQFHRLHHQPQPLIVANAWNARSAQMLEAAGFQAIATSSGAIAESLGYPDGEQIPFDELLYIVRRIRAVTTVPLSVDMEKGYTNDLDQFQEHIARLIDLGVAGINIEDSQDESTFLNKLERIKSYLAQTGRQLFINARTDGFLQKVAQPLEVTIARAKTYREAGADGLFVTGVQDPEIISQIISATPLPVNVVGNPRLATVEQLAACGVRRISMAVLAYKATYRHLERMATEVQTTQSFAPLF